ncbi:hypothetical protein QYF36_008298 [Acer negundo]|nr:hypothetical protein QYF36_008298 [Acer negundo]
MIGAGLANEEVRYVDVLSGDSDLGVANEEILYSDSQETKEKLIQATMEELRCMEEADVEDGDAAELELLSSDNSVAKEEMVRAAVEAEMRNSFAVVTVDSDEELILTTTAVEELLKGNRGCSSVPIQGLKQRNKCNSIPYSVHAMRTRNSKSKGTVGCLSKKNPVEEEADKVLDIGKIIGFDFSDIKDEVWEAIIRREEEDNVPVMVLLLGEVLVFVSFLFYS